MIETALLDTPDKLLGPQQNATTSFHLNGQKFFRNLYTTDAKV